VNLISRMLRSPSKNREIKFHLSRRDGRACFQLRSADVILESQNSLNNQDYLNRETMQGIGVGLLIASKCVEVHQGEINIDISESSGTTITIMIPL
jgi:signal transduction histidine kinase